MAAKKKTTKKKAKGKTAGKNPVGRPTDYSDKVLDKAVEYVCLFFDAKKQPKDEIIPSIEGLALHLEVSRPTL